MNVKKDSVIFLSMSSINVQLRNVYYLNWIDLRSLVYCIAFIFTKTDFNRFFEII